MWHMTLVDADGKYYRETFMEKPDMSDVKYYEDYYSISKVIGKDYGIYDCHEKVKATVLNIFESGE